MTKYAEGTTVAASRSLEEIKSTLIRARAVADHRDRGGEVVKAWKVFEKGFYEVTCFVLADTKSKAIKAARDADESWSFRESPWTEMRARRMPELDGGITDETLFKHGKAWLECPGCVTELREGDMCDDYTAPSGESECKRYFSGDGSVWCSEACYLEHHQRHQVKAWGNAVCLYAE